MSHTSPTRLHNVPDAVKTYSTVTCILSSLNKCLSLSSWSPEEAFQVRQEAILLWEILGLEPVVRSWWNLLVFLESSVFPHLKVCPSDSCQCRSRMGSSQAVNTSSTVSTYLPLSLTENFRAEKNLVTSTVEWKALVSVSGLCFAKPFSAGHSL